MQFIFITITLMLLVFLTFFVKTPKASLPLISIYIIYIISFLLKDSSHTSVNKNIMAVNDGEIMKIENENINEVQIATTKITDNKNDNILIEKNIIKEKKKVTKIENNKQLVLKNKPKNKNSEKISSLKDKNKKSNSLKKKKEISNGYLSVKDIKICKYIKQRTPVGSDVVFTNNVDSLYCYTKIQNTGKKTEIKHIWYYEGQIMTQVRYNAKKSSNYRSWTKKTILPNQIGFWRVDIQDNNGTIIATKGFEIKKVQNNY